MTELARQETLILKHLKRGKAITSLEALRIYGCSRLAARVYNLRGQGVDVRRELVRLSTGKRVARYSLQQN